MKKARFIFQNNLIAEKDVINIKEICKKIGLEYVEVLVIPFSTELPDFPIDEEYENFYYGSTTFMYNIYNQLGNPKGLFFDDDKFTMKNYFDKYKELMLNYDEAIITTFKDFSLEDHKDDKLFFIRPNKDDKSFDGNVIPFGKIKNWKDNFMKYDNTVLNENTKILVGEPYNITREWRNYIVDGKVVESSLYRKNFKLVKTKEDIPDSMLDFVKECLEIYKPDDCLAMDIAECGGDYYIIECGCLNSVGFYTADIENLIKEQVKFIEK